MEDDVARLIRSLSYSWLLVRPPPSLSRSSFSACAFDWGLETKPHRRLFCRCRCSLRARLAVPIVLLGVGLFRCLSLLLLLLLLTVSTTRQQLRESGGIDIYWLSIHFLMPRKPAPRPYNPWSSIHGMKGHLDSYLVHRIFASFADSFQSCVYHINTHTHT